ncbi:Hypothetical protein D9617_1g081750 [Elsinoe fawcettii]|nr:Hypothetical protein D9617_1g081750 [Elsinoe fawcettii]
MADITTTSLQAIGLAGAFIQSGFSFGVSWMVLPSTYTIDPSVSLPIFKNIFRSGGIVVVPTALLAAIGTAVAAYRDPEQRTPLSIAAALAAAPVVFTQLFMMSGIQKLLSYEANGAERAKAGTNQIVSLLQAWSAQNYVRAGLSFTAGALGLYLLLQKFDVKQKRL